MINLDKFKAKLKNIQEDSTELDQIKDLFEKNDLDSDYVKSFEIKTSYNTFTVYGDAFRALIKYEDWEQFKKDMCDEFAQCLPDKFDEYFNTAKLLEDINESGWGKTILGQTQSFIKQSNRDVFIIDDYEPIMYSDDYILISY